MADMLKFELVSPEKLMLSKDVAMVTVPGGEGDYGVLPGHAPMITTVRAGVIETFIEEGSAAADRIFVAGGFAEVTQERCTVLAEEAIPVAELNREKLEEALRGLNEKLAAAPDEEKIAIQNKAFVVAAKLAVAA